MTRLIYTTIALFLLLMPARAHYLWIESESAADSRVYFGEFNEGVREKAGGRLDERDAIELRLARADGATDPLPFTKRTDHFTAKAPQEGWLLVQDLTSEVKDWTASDIGIVKPMFYARAAVAGKLTAAKPALTLDIIPDVNNPRNLRVWFKGQPLAKAKVLVHAPNEWSKELEANANGEVAIATPWPGRYVVAVIHKERERGEFRGKAFEAVRHRTTFSQVY